MKLYCAPRTISIAVALGLEEAGIAYDLAPVDFARGAQMEPEYLTINPKGRVPALVTDDGTTLTETGALLEYIAALRPEAGLLPVAPEDAAHMRSVMYYLASTMHVAHAHGMRGNRWADRQESLDDMATKVPQTMAVCADYVQNDCLRGNFVCGSSLSIADLYLFIVCTWLEGDGVSLTSVPMIKAFLDRMDARDSVKTVRAQGML